MQIAKRSFSATLTALALVAATNAFAHGDVTPQQIDITGLEPLKDNKVWVDKNPYSGNPKAIEIGHHAFAQNCARCHGIDAVSGGIAPDLREKLPLGQDGDDIFKERMVNGAIRNGITYMPKFDGIVAQEGLWAIRSWLETVSVDAPAKPADAAASTSTTAAPATTTPSATTTSTTAAPATTTPSTTTTSTTAAPATTTPSATTTSTTAAPATTDAKPADTAAKPEEKK